MADLNRIALFTKVVEAGSFSGAARALRLPKATVSRGIARLESELGARLLHRTTRRVELTGLGRAYYEQAVRGLAHLAMANEQVAAAQAEPAGTLRVAAPVDFGTVYLVDWVAEFLADFPKTRIELKLSDEFVNLIEARVDVAFRTGRLPNSSLIARKIGPTRRILVASPAYLRRRGTPRRIGDLEQHEGIVFGASLDNTVWRLDGPKGGRELPVRGRIAVDSARAALRAAIAGLGVALLPEGLVADDVRAGRLRQILSRYGVDGGGLYLVYPSNRHVSAALRAFLDFVVAKYRAARPRCEPPRRTSPD